MSTGSGGVGESALNRQDGEVSSIGCCPGLELEPWGGHQISDREDSSLGGLWMGGDPASWPVCGGRGSGRAEREVGELNLTQDGRAYPHFFENGETPSTRNVYGE